MALFRTSRYADPLTSQDVMLIAPDGTQTRTLYRSPQWSGTYNIMYYIWRDGDRIDRIAQFYLGDPQLWWQIMDLNPEILDANQIAPGTRVRIPSA